MLERIKNFALYGDTDRESYLRIKDKIATSNRIVSVAFSSIAAILIFIMFMLSHKQAGLQSTKPVYLVGTLVSLGILALALTSWKFPKLTYAPVYLTVAFPLVYGISIATLTRPNDQTVTFMVMLIFVPLVVTDRPIRMAAIIALFTAAFIVLASQYKAKEIFAVDVSDAIIFGLLSIASETIVNRVKIRGYVLEDRLHVMSETDQLTGLNNRNCYEYRLGQYDGQCRHSICCIYLDGDGLHELNNQKGHREGDRMLRTIACEMKNAFGSSDTYRIGGDEFVAFVLDQSLPKIEDRIEGIQKAMSEAHYHVSVGYEYAEGQELKLSELVSRAESRMYENKAAYYETHDRRKR